ncbi:Phospholipase C [Entomortierella chlamydospora]|nr:Phospholipase C [Entomortierella chlamydospora]
MPQSSSGPRPVDPSLSKTKRNHSFRNSLPARLKPPFYRQESSSSSEVLPLPPPKDNVYSSTSETDKIQNPRNDNIRESATLHISRLSPAADFPVDPDTAALSQPRTTFIRRTSSFHSQKESSESGKVEVPDEDIIMFTSTPPVSIIPSSSARIPRGAANLPAGSPDQAVLSSSQESPVVQWPRGGTSAANRSQEHFLRTHHRTSTSSEASLKEMQANMATTPPATSVLRQDSQRPSLDRQISRSNVVGGSSATTEPQQTQNAGHTKASSSDCSAESTESHAVAASGAVAAAGSIATPPSDNTQQLIAQESDATKASSTETLPPLSPTVVRQLSAGILMLKISAKKQHSRNFKLDLEQGRILWDSRKFGRINVEQIKELRKGKAARMYREQLGVKPEHEERWLTIIYSAMGKYKTLHLVAPTKDKYEDWIMAVERMWSVKREEADGLPQLQRKTSQWLKEHWMDADKNVDSKLGYEEIVRLCYRLNINFSRKEIRARFDQADEKKQGSLDFSDFTRFVKLLKERKDIIGLFYKISKSDSMTLGEFTDFMVTTQKSKLDEDQIKEIYGKHVDKTIEKFSVDSLASFLLSVDNSIVSPKHMYVHQDMTQTLSSYYISSSHNTYLLGHQLTGISSIEGYIRALQSGCRCVELDCWDGPDGQPIVYHGHTLTSKILFRDVIEAISTYAFVNSPYPLILSLELHCDIAQQEIMANIMRTKLGSWLVVAPIDSNTTSLPSPDQLKYKILVKSKVLPPGNSSQELSTDTESESEKESESDSEGAKVQKPKTKTKKVRVARALSDITIYCQSRHFSGFSHEDCSPYKIVSLSERVSLRLAKQSLQEYINMNKTHLTRTYPAGFRINSTNYDPHNHWAAGAQIVALNYQSYDRGMQMNTAMYAMNGRCGYVLKPQSLRLAPGEFCNHDKAPSFSKTHPVEITLQIISAQQLPRPYEAVSGDIVDPVCEIELHVPGLPYIKQKTRHISDNGFNPMWNEEFKFRVDYEHHELVFFRFVVQDEDIKFSDLVASYCISLDCMEEGYRHIQLVDPSGDPYLYSTLFVRINIEPVPQLYTLDAALSSAPHRDGFSLTRPIEEYSHMAVDSYHSAQNAIMSAVEVLHSSQGMTKSSEVQQTPQGTIKSSVEVQQSSQSSIKNSVEVQPSSQTTTTSSTEVQQSSQTTTKSIVEGQHSSETTTTSAAEVRQSSQTTTKSSAETQHSSQTTTRSVVQVQHSSQTSTSSTTTKRVAEVRHSSNVITKGGLEADCNRSLPDLPGTPLALTPPPPSQTPDIVALPPSPPPK